MTDPEVTPEPAPESTPEIPKIAPTSVRKAGAREPERRVDERGNDIPPGMPRIAYVPPPAVPAVKPSKAARFGHTGGTVPL